MTQKKITSSVVSVGELAFAFNQMAKIMKESSIKWSAAINSFKPKKTSFKYLLKK
jgi:hypothetical protein